MEKKELVEWLSKKLVSLTDMRDENYNLNKDVININDVPTWNDGYLRGKITLINQILERLKD